MADNNQFQTTVESLFKGMESFITTKTVIGDAITMEDGTIILPLVDVSFGVAAVHLLMMTVRKITAEAVWEENSSLALSL